MPIPISPRLLPTLFASLARTPTWTLRRTLQSDNPLDLHGDLHGEASFQPLSATPSTATPTSSPTEDPQTQTQTLYTESGSLPATLGPNLRWTKSYIWRLSPEGRISVWFVKVTKDAATHPEADYLFHEVEFEVAVDGERAADAANTSSSNNNNDETYVTPPTPPEPLSQLEATATVVVTARGNHLCIKDMYRTAYAFRVRAESGEVVSWASRHVVKGPKKDQDIVNLYSVG